jgi:protoporphyrin/coproporphyrin ferrochelatase
MLTTGDSIGVVLFQLGGPDSLAAVEPFLYNLFLDPDIIDFPLARLARPALAKMISSRRARKVQEHYASIGGKSPIGELTERQARALERELRKTLAARVLVAMRYWHPLTEEALREIGEKGFGRLVLLPLYPQYSKTTTGSSLNEWNRQYRPRPGVAVSRVAPFYDNPLYLDAVVEKINEGLAASEFEPGESPLVCATSSDAGFEFPDSSFELRPSGVGHRPPAATAGLPADVVLVFSAHGVPMAVIKAGDPYQRHVEETVQLVMERGGWPNRHVLCYQSRVGPGRWLEPTLDSAVQQLAAEGERRVLAIPISFVTDHVETLSEIDIEARALAGRLGIEQFAMMPALNDSPKFIEALASLVVEALSASQT